MRKLKFYLAALFSSVLLTTQVSSNQQTPIPCYSCKCQTIVAKGCVGECGNTCTVEYIVNNPSSGSILTTLCLENIQTSLCPNTGASAAIYVNKVFIKKVDITKLGSGTSFLAKYKDVVTVVVSTYPINNGIVCIRLGNLNFVLKN